MNIDEFAGRFDRVKKKGNGYHVCCPVHDDKEQSLSIDHGKNGGIVLKCFAGCDTKAILDAVDCAWSDILPDDGWRAKDTDWHKGRGAAGGNGAGASPSKKAPKDSAPVEKVIDETYDYVDADGYLVFQVVRYKPKTFRQRVRNGNGEWTYSTAGITKPLYRLPLVLEAVKNGETVFYCEGEKDVHALEALGFVATTHCGGAAAWGKNPQYIEALKDARLVVLPDNDLPGRQLAIQIRKDLPQSKVIYLPGLPDKGDVSDWIKGGGTAADLKALLDAAMSGAGAGGTDVDALKSAHFRCLGFNGGHFYFLPAASKQVRQFTAPELSQKAHLYTMAPREYWEFSPEYGDCEGRNGRDYSAIAEVLINRCIAAGIYSNDLRRGMGAWIDRDRTVLHMGNVLSVDGVHTDLIDIDSRYVYEARGGASIVEGKPISDEYAERFAHICAMPAWEDPIYGVLLGGWVSLAPICGTLKWRPHIWVNGPAGCGKSYIATNIVGRTLAGVIRQFASSTTEAGIRQKLASDSLPVLFDEAEGDTRGSRENINRILELMRHSSSDSDALITKGSAGGVATDFAIRSMFCMSSIAHGIHRRADESRTTILRLTDPGRSVRAREAFTSLAESIFDLISGDFSAGFVARACANAKVTRANADTFAEVLSGMDGGRRYGDQIGTLLAGYVSLLPPHIWTKSDAEAMVRQLNLDALNAPEMARGKDEEQCLAFLLQQQIRVDDGVKTATLTVGECIELVATNSHTYTNHHKALMRIGIIVEHDKVCVSNTHNGLSRLFQSSPYGEQWATYLRRLPESDASKATKRFAGCSTRYVALHISHFL